MILKHVYGQYFSVVKTLEAKKFSFLRLDKERKRPGNILWLSNNWQEKMAPHELTEWKS